MSWDYLFESKKDTQHKVFISYYHKDDQYYRNRFEELFGDLFISKSVEPGDIDTDVSTEYIKRLIQQNYITDTSVLVVLDWAVVIWACMALVWRNLCSGSASLTISF